MTHTTSSTRNMVFISLTTAVTCIFAPLSIPIPVSPVPVTLTNLILFISIFLLGWKGSLISYTIYLLIGFAGLPVFSGFTGGIGKLAGPTGGYLVGFFFLIFIEDWFLRCFRYKKASFVLGMAFGMAATYIFGTLWLALQMDTTFFAALSIGVFPYLAGDALKIAAAIFIAPTLQERLRMAAIH